jgi:hypothetical protein
VPGAIVGEATEGLTRYMTGRPDVLGLWAEEIFGPGE